MQSTLPTEVDLGKSLRGFNLLYGISGALLLAVLDSPNFGKAILWFLAGWALSTLSFEVFRGVLKPVVMVYSQTEETSVAKLPAFIYALLIGKIAFSGTVLLLLQNVAAPSPLAFVFGAAVLVVSSGWFAIREYFYA
jgi:hypothetical protein